MKTLLCSGICVLALTASANASFFTEDWTNAGATQGGGPINYNLTSVGWSSVDNVVVIGESHNSTLTTHVYDAATGAAAGAIPPKLPTTGLVSPWLGFFGGIHASNNGKYFGDLSQGTPGDLAVWASLTDPAPTQVINNAGFSRNLHVQGDRIYSIGSADNGPIDILDPDPTTGDYMVQHSLSPGGKADVTAAPDGSMVWGLNGLQGPIGDPGNVINQWSWDAGSSTYLNDGAINYHAMGLGRCVGLGSDTTGNTDQDLLFVLDFDYDQIAAIALGAAAVGDEYLVATWQHATATFWYYGGITVDEANDELYWGTRGDNPTGEGHFGNLSYIPEPTSLVLLALGGLALRRRR